MKDRTQAGRAFVFAAAVSMVAAGMLMAAASPDRGEGLRQAASVPHVVFVTGDDEYRSEITMPMIAAILERDYGFKTSVAMAKPRPQTKDNIEALDALATADLMVMFTRFRALPDDQLTRILDYSASGKPMVGLRTSTHAFMYPDGSPNKALNDAFSIERFGQKWITHHGHRSSTDVAIHAGAASHPVLRGVTPFHARSWLYHVAPLDGGDRNTILLDGTSVDSDKKARAAEFPPVQPVAWTRDYKGARVFFTTLGHPQDFADASMRRLLINGILWSLNRDIPAGGAKAEPNGTYTPPESFDLSKVK